jgi:hypothetical protein
MENTRILSLFLICLGLAGLPSASLLSMRRSSACYHSASITHRGPGRESGPARLNFRENLPTSRAGDSLYVRGSTRDGRVIEP